MAPGEATAPRRNTYTPHEGDWTGEEKQDDEADTRPVGKTEKKETRGSVYPVWDGEGCVSAGRLSPDGD